MSGPTFDELADLIRESQGFKPDKRISPDLQFERDLGITGDDGKELLAKIEDRYGIQFTAESFGLTANEFLFNSEGIDLFGVIWRTLGRKPEPEIRPFTVGELHAAVCRELDRNYSTNAPQN